MTRYLCDWLRRLSPFGRKSALWKERWYFPTGSQISRLPFHSLYRSFNHLYIYRDVGESKSSQRVVCQVRCDHLGYPGDPVFDNKNLPVRSSFMKNRSFIVICKLEQNVLVLEDYVVKYWKTIPRDVAGDNSILLTDLLITRESSCLLRGWFGHFKSVSYAVAISFV